MTNVPTPWIASAPQAVHGVTRLKVIGGDNALLRTYSSALPQALPSFGGGSRLYRLSRS